MRRISDTIARLAALRAQLPTHAPDHIPSDRLSPLPEARSSPGALKAKFYLPKDLPRGAPLVVVLHGCTQTATSYDHHSGWSQLADEAGIALLFPEQQRARNPNLCFNWFLPADVRRGSGEALSIRQMVEAMVVAHGLDRRRIFVTGLSAGGAMAAAMLATYPEVFAGGAIIAGLAYGSATTIPEAFDRMRGHGGPSELDLQRALRIASEHPGPWPRISIWQGSADHTVAPSNAEAIVAQWRGVHQLGTVPTHSETTGRRTKEVWCDATGETVIETNIISGMGHGTPLGHDGLGTPGPYMLDVGISSTREIARFWGITGTAEAIMPAASTSAPYAGEQQLTASRAREEEKAINRSRERSDGSSPRGKAPDSGVRKIIEDALRAAGLMR